MRENIQVVVDDVARSSVGNTAQEVSSKYQLQLVHVYTLIEQVDPAPQIKSELTEIFTVRPKEAKRIAGSGLEILRAAERPSNTQALAMLRAELVALVVRVQMAQEHGNPLLASLNAKAASFVNFAHFLEEYRAVKDLLRYQATPFNFARVGLVADKIPCGASP